MTDAGYYEDLGIDRDATPDEIKRAHRAASKRTHPDVAGDEGRDAFERVQSAYVVLSDPDLRARYDRGEKVDDGPVDSEAEIKVIMLDAFNKAVGVVNVVHDDIIEVTKANIAEGAKALRGSIDALEADIANLEQIIARLHVTASQDPIGDHIAGKIASQCSAIVAARRQIALHMEAHERCRSYFYRREPRSEVVTRVAVAI